jgi:hypothetical protein
MWISRCDDMDVGRFRGSTCVPSVSWWFWHLYFINHKGHEGTQRMPLDALHIRNFIGGFLGVNLGCAARAWTPAPTLVLLVS